jgi:hypothetical protein
MPLGLISSEQQDDYWSSNARRRIFKAFPNGAATLTGLLSMSESEDTPLPEFTWTEDRWQEIRTQTIAGPTAASPFYAGGGTVATANNADYAANASVRVYVADASMFQIDDVLKIFNVGQAASGSTATKTQDMVGRVTLTDTSDPNANYVEMALVTAFPDVLNIAGNVGLYVLLIGSAYHEGARSRTGRIRYPYDLTNYTQIFKTPFELTRTALKEPVKYDSSGDYKRISQNNGIDHLSQLEYAAFFGERAKTTAVDADTGQTVSRRFTGGLRWFLDQWEKGTAYGQTDISAQTDWRLYTNKRVIKLAGNTVTKADFTDLNTRVFERTNASTWEKLCVCGSGYLAKVTDMYERQIVAWKAADEGFKGWNFTMSQHTGNAGTVYYKTHPLFNNPIMRNSAFYIDLGYIGYRPLTDSDTDIQPMIQLPDADKRKDQWLTECGFEFRFPEAFMYVENLGGITST